MKTWHEKAPKYFSQFENLIEENYPDFRILNKNNIIYVKGRLLLKSQENKSKAGYNIEIEIPNNYPKSIPKIRELNGAIKKVPRQHFNRDGTACLFVKDEAFKYLNNKLTIIDFINGPVKDFFISQHYFSLTGKWIYGERGHGDKGIIEFYKEEIGTEDKNVIIKLWGYALDTT